MSVRFVVTFTATRGNGATLAEAYRMRCVEVVGEPGCQQYEIFQSLLDPDRLALLERWESPASLNAHSQLDKTRPRVRPDLRARESEREYYPDQPSKMGAGQ
jgi:quinol monooxygenase YgiN